MVFWRQIDENPETGCWEWMGHKDMKGYGVATTYGQPWRAHRLAFCLEGGTIPAGMQLDHLCRVRHCVNPAHLEVVTSAENTRRGVGNKLGEWQAQKTHCPRGHLYDEENTYITRVGSRNCRACNRRHCALYYQQKKEQAHGS